VIVFHDQVLDVLLFLIYQIEVDTHSLMIDDLKVSNNILTFAAVNSKSDTEESDLIRSYKKQQRFI